MAELVTFPPSVALCVKNSQPGSEIWESLGFWEHMDSRGPRLPGRLHRLLGEKAWLRGARLTSKHPISFKCSKVFSVFVDIMNPRPSAGFLFCCRREHQARMGVETDGCDCFRAVAGTDRVGTQTSRPFHVAATWVASGLLRSPGTLVE